MKNWKILLLLALICVIGFGIIPFQKQVSALKKQEITLAEKKEKLANEFKRIQKNFQELSAENEGKRSIQIPVGYNQETFLSDIERITQKNGFVVDNISFSLGYNDAVRSQQINARFELKGARQNIYNFLLDVEQNPNFMGMESFNLASNGNDGKSTIGVELYSFFQKQ